MPPFNYGSGYVNPYVQSLTQLLQQPGQIEAQRAMTVGNAQAQAAQASGQAYGNAIQGAGQAISGAIQQATDPRMQMARSQVADLKAMDAAFSQPGGRDAILAKLPGHLRPQVAASFTAADEAALKLQEQQLKTTALSQDYVYTLATQIAAHNYDPVAAQLGLSHAKQTFANNPAIAGQINQIESQLQQNATPDTVRQLVEPIIKAHDAAEKPVVLPPTPEGAAPAQLVRPGFSGATPVATGGQSRPKPPTEAELAVNAANGDEGATAAMAILKPKPIESAQSVDKLLDNKPATLMFDPKTKQYTDASGKIIENAATRIKPIPSAAAIQMSGGSLSDVALDEAARVYNQTGKLPPGMGAVGMARQTAVMNRAAQLDPNAALAANAATFKADSQNLTRLQTTEGTLSSFERAAGKNLDVFMALADKVPDTGVPWVNQPIRSVNARGLGSAEQAAFNAARDVALREIARVTNDPKLSGALTDTARKEVLGLIPADATFAQIKRVTQVLKQDMANVHSGVNDEIATVKDRLGANPNRPATPAVPANVAKALKGIAPGIHKLSDGSSWMVGADGSITKQ